MFIGHSEIVTFPLYRLHADKPARYYGAGCPPTLLPQVVIKPSPSGTPRSRHLFLEVMEQIRQRHQFLNSGNRQDTSYSFLLPGPRPRESLRISTAHGDI